MNATVIPFPTSEPRPMLQASVHARGKRPFLFRGRVDEWHAPGVETTRNGTTCAVDAAWLVQPVLGTAVRSPPFPGMPGIADRVRWLAQNWRTPNGKQLHPFQVEGSVFLAERDYAILTDEMGIGKSPQAIIAAEGRLSMASIASPNTPVVLVICPALAKRNWQREIKRWSGNDAAILDGQRPSAVPQARWVIVNYDILYGQHRRDAAGVVHPTASLPGWGGVLANKFLIIIVDEAHQLRGKGSQRTTAIRTMAKGVPVMWALTGTPQPNYVRDLWALIDTVTDGLAGAYWPWARAYCGAVSGQYGWEDKGSSREEELKRRLTFFMLGRSKSSVGLQLPPFEREVYKVDVEVSAPTVHEGRRALDKGGAVASAFRLTARAKRKIVVEQAVDSLRAGQKVVVFLYMREQCDAVAKAVHDKVDCTVLCVHGDLTPEGRDKQATLFREASAPCAFVATIDSVGVAISLIGADLVIFGDLVAEPWKLLQAEKRCHRFDSQNSVLVRYLVATGTIDDGLAETVIDKLDVLAETLGKQNENEGLAEVLGKRSNEEIVDGLFSRLKQWSGGADE